MTQLPSNTFTPKTKEEWRSWLEKNHEIEESVWLILYKKNSGTPSISWSDAVDEALCFAWIDSTKKTIDTEKYMQYFGRRKADSTWSKINKNKVTLFIEHGLMSPAGIKSIEIAKQNGSWTILDSVEELIIPEDLEREFSKYSNSKEFFFNLSKSVRKMMLHWIVMAKRPETRAKRIAEIVENASEGKKLERF